MKIRKPLTALLATAAVAAAPLVAAPAAHAATNPVYDVGFVQTGQVVDARQTSIPVTVGWRLTSTTTAARHDVYRYDYYSGSTTFLGSVSGSVTRLAHSVAASGGADSNATAVRSQYQVRSYDGNGSYLGQQASQYVRPKATDDASSSITYSGSGWTRKTVSGTTLSHQTQSTTSGAAVTYNGCSFSLGLIATRSAAGGKADVLVNNVKVGTVNFNAATTQKRQLVWKSSSLSYKCAAVTIKRVSGQINVDSFQVVAPA